MTGWNWRCDLAVGRSIALLRGHGRVAALALVAGALALRIIDPGFVTELRVRGFDLVEQFWPHASDRARVVIVDIDEKSLGQYGQWPWPWHLLAQLVRRIAEGQPRVVGIDIVFAGRDRLSPTRDRARTAHPTSGSGRRVGAATAE
jgi:CHASE2 domain-containing sensor protein